MRSIGVKKFAPGEEACTVDGCAYMYKGTSTTPENREAKVARYLARNAHLDVINRQCWDLRVENDPKQLLPIKHNTHKDLPFVGIV